MKKHLFLGLIFTLLSCATFASKPGKLAQIIRDYYAAVDAQDFEKVASYLADNVKVSIPFSPQSMDKMSFKQLGMSMGTALPNMRHKVLEVTEGKNSAAFKAAFSSTNTGEMQGNQPTGNSVELPFMGYMNFDKSGKITSLDIQFDVTAFNAQLMKGLPDQKMIAEKSIRELFNLMDAGQTDKFAMYCAPDFKISNPMVPESSPIQVFQGVLSAQKTAFPDMHHEIVEMVSDGHYVTTKGIFKGTNTGSMMGNPPTGNKVEIPFLVLDQLDDKGKITSRDVQFDIKSFEGQLMKGLPPMPDESEQKEIAYIQDLYKLFGEGNIPELLNRLSPDITWDAKDNPIVPGSYFTNQKEVANFFGGLAGKATFTAFVPSEFIVQGNTVIAIGSQKYILKKTGKEYASNWVMHWKFRDGKPYYFKELFDGNLGL